MGDGELDQTGRVTRYQGWGDSHATDLVGFLLKLDPAVPARTGWTEKAMPSLEEGSEKPN